MASAAEQLALAHKQAIVNLGTLTDRDLLRVWEMVSGWAASVSAGVAG